MTEKPLRVTLIGSLPPPIGGTSISFEHLVNYLNPRKDIETLVVDTSPDRARGARSVLHLLGILRQIVAASFRSDVVSLHVCTSSLPSLGLFVLAVSRLLHKPFVLRKFGGTNYLDKGEVAGAISHFVVRHANLYLAQTGQLVTLAKDMGIPHVKWYPTSRPMQIAAEQTAEQKKTCRRFVFLGQIRKAKGIMEIIDAGERFSGEEDIAVDIFGTLDFDIREDTFSGLKKVRYCGSVKPDQVHDMLSSYDALLLPSYHPGEGYPGVVLEAYGAGLPVICTRWQALPEIVNEKTGILIEPRNSDELYEAMSCLIRNDETYSRLRNGVMEARCAFSAEYWTAHFVELCRAVAGAKA